MDFQRLYFFLIFLFLKKNSLVFGYLPLFGDFFTSTFPPSSAVCKTADTDMLCDASSPKILKSSCYNRGCCYRSDLMLCLLPIPHPGRTVCRTGCQFVKIEKGGLKRVWNGRTPYKNEEGASIEVQGPCRVHIDRMDVESPKLCRHDFLRIEGQAICTVLPEPIELSDGFHEIRWKTDKQITGKGFAFHIEPIHTGINDAIIDDASKDDEPDGFDKDKTEDFDANDDTHDNDPDNNGLSDNDNPETGHKEEDSSQDTIKKPIHKTSIDDDETNKDKTKISERHDKLKTRLKKPTGALDHTTTYPLISDLKRPVHIVQPKNPNKERIIINPEITPNDNETSMSPTSNKSSITTTVVLGAAATGVGAILLGVGYWCVRRNTGQEDPLANFGTGYEYNVTAGRQHQKRPDSPWI